MSRGLFIAFEGIDGSGKSTHARRIARETGALFTFEPGDSELGVQLRELLLHAKVALTPETEALLMLSDRSHHVASTIAPTLAQGRAVIADRFLASTISYQGYGRGVNLDLLSRWRPAAVPREMTTVSSVRVRSSKNASVRACWKWRTAIRPTP